jgi:hypothetical protein
MDRKTKRTFHKKESRIVCGIHISLVTFVLLMEGNLMSPLKISITYLKTKIPWITL